MLRRKCPHHTRSVYRKCPHSSRCGSGKCGSSARSLSTNNSQPSASQDPFTNKPARSPEWSRLVRNVKNSIRFQGTQRLGSVMVVNMLLSATTACFSVLFHAAKGQVKIWLGPYPRLSMTLVCRIQGPSKTQSFTIRTIPMNSPPSKKHMSNFCGGERKTSAGQFQADLSNATFRFFRFFRHQPT